MVPTGAVYSAGFPVSSPNKRATAKKQSPSSASSSILR